MIDCPYCGSENIPGSDECEECGQPLSDVQFLAPATALEDSLLKAKVRDLNLKQPCIVAPTDTVGKVLQTMADNRIGCVMVVDGDQTVGIFSERDALVKLNTEAAEHIDRPISDFMTPDPQTLESSAKIAFAVQRMDVGGYRHIPIVADGKLQGIISVRHILNYLTENMGR
jgi:CBS domain-containing protein